MKPVDNRRILCYTRPAMMSALSWTNRLGQWRSLLQSVDWESLQREVEQELQAHITIIGPSHTGKSTLFNTLLRQRVSSPVSDQPSTMHTTPTEAWGPLLLTDTPGFDQGSPEDNESVVWQTVEQTDAILLVLDATCPFTVNGLTLERVRSLGRPVVVVLNKIDLVPPTQRSEIVTKAKQHYAPLRVTPISARLGAGIADNLTMALLAVAPTLAVPLAQAWPAHRRRAAQRIIRQAIVATTTTGMQPVPMANLSLMLTVQARMVLRLAAAYGEIISPSHAKELVSTMLASLGVRYLAQQAARVLPGPGWLISSGIAAAGTWTMGQVAMQYFEGGQALSAVELRNLYNKLLRSAPKRLLGAGS